MKTRTRPSLDVCVVDTDKLATICRTPLKLYLQQIINIHIR